MPEIDRRNFLKIVGASAGAAAAAGCADPVQKLIPYVVQPEEITPGVAVIYASTCRECPVGCGIHVRTREGRPIKIEGNPDHPVNRGALCARGQAGTQRTYHPGRFQTAMRRDAGGLSAVGWDEAISAVSKKVALAGAKTWLLTGETGPTLDALIDRWIAATGAGGRVVYEPFDFASLKAAAAAVFGTETRPNFDLSGADFIVDFGSDFMETWVSPVEHTRQFAAARNVESDGHGARFVYVGPRQSMTASNADEWLAPTPGSEGTLALAIARAAADQGGRGNHAALQAVLAKVSIDKAASQTGISATVIRRLGGQLAKSRHPIALPPGQALTGRRGTASAAAVLILNAVVGAVGDTVTLPPASGGSAGNASFADVTQLIAAMNAGDVDVLIIHDSNPVYSLPADAGFNDALAKVATVVSTASLADETAASAHWVLPDHTPLESWGDVQSAAGVRSIVQPTLRPLYDTRAFGDTLLDTGRAMGQESKLPSGSFRGVLEAFWADTDWRGALARGGVFASTPGGGASVAASVDQIDFSRDDLGGGGDFTLVAFPSAMLYDGRGADLSWLQETPDPVSKVAWDSWAEISTATASALGLGFGDLIRIETARGTLDVPVLPRGGIRDDVVAVPLGQGHIEGHFAGRSDEAGSSVRGVNASDLLPAVSDESGARAWLTTRAKLSKAVGSARIPLTQRNDNQRGRQLAVAMPLAALSPSGHGEDSGHDGGHGESHEIRRPYDPVDDSHEDSEYRWGMAIDVDRCNGCSACIVACSIENNIPTVGESGVRRNRQMNWLRIERYVGDGHADMTTGRPGPVNTESVGDTDVRHLPMLCQQCGAAPCEPVCPVIATYHNVEGLNGMIYNRCIGTRYCSNNCPYKVRRYNWFDYQIENWPEPMRLGLNPDVTVRGQGVMEKCTFCIQRIEGGRQLAKDESRPIADGEVTPACAQTCPTDAITFGNLKDRKSRVSERAGGVRAYHALHVLNTRPAIAYLAKVHRGADEGHEG